MDSAHRRLATSAPHPSAPLPEVGPGVAPGARRPLGPTGLEVFPLGLGTADFSRLHDIRAAVAVLDRYAEVGGNLVHVSDRDPEQVRLVGDWVRSRRIRDDVVLAARIRPSRLAHGGADDLAADVERMLALLGTDRIDLLTIDVSAARQEKIDLERELAAADPLVARGTVRALGIHGADAPLLLAARLIASGGYPRIDVLEAPYGLGDRGGFEQEVRRVATAQGVAVLPVQVVPRGILAGDQAAGRKTGAARLLRWRGKLARTLDAVSNDAGLRPAATAFAWARMQQGIVAPVIDAFAAHQIDELAPATTVDLTRSQLVALDRASSR